MTQKNFLPYKNVATSKVNWLFLLIALTEVPQVKEILGNIAPITIPILSVLGIVSRTFFTSSMLKFK